MKLYNTLTKDYDELNANDIGIYSCGPTVYDNVHIGNLSCFIYADMLRRTLSLAGHKVTHVMNFTDVDDKTIKRSREMFQELDPTQALSKLTKQYEIIFLQDSEAIGNNLESVRYIRATDSIEAMRRLIQELHDDGFAYIAGDGVYFSIDKYRASGKKYGQLLKLSEKSTSNARINNDEYDKESLHDFALWKQAKAGEPVWEFELDGQDVSGRPGWHIECSAMSVAHLGQPFDIHTGGVDLIFPHHENEIAQSTAGKNSVYAKLFFHNEHLLVEGKKMSKSLNNFYTLEDIRKQGYDPLAFRLMVLQSHYRSQSNFTWEGLQAAHNRLKHWQSLADLRWQGKTISIDMKTVKKHMLNDLSTPSALSELEQLLPNESAGLGISEHTIKDIDEYFGVNLSTVDISAEQKKLVRQRHEARQAEEWAQADKLRDELANQGIGLRDTNNGQVWFRN